MLLNVITGIESGNFYIFKKDYQCITSIIKLNSNTKRKQWYL